MTQFGDGAFDPTPQIGDIGELLAVLSGAGLSGDALAALLSVAGELPDDDAAVPPGGIGVARVPHLTLNDLGPELAREVIDSVGSLTPGMPDPADLDGFGEAQVGVQVAADGTVERFAFPTGDLTGLGDQLRARLSGPTVVGAKAIELVDNLTMWTCAYDAPTAADLAGQVPNVAATVVTWMVHSGVLPVFGPVLFTAGGPTEDGSFAGLDGQGIALLEEIVGAIRPGAVDRFGPRLRELAADGAYLQTSPV